MFSHLNDNSDSKTFRSIIFTSRNMRRKMKALFRKYDLTGSQFHILSRIPENGLPLTQLAEITRMDPGNLSGVVDRLEEKGWIERQRSSEDRRVVMVFLRPDGRDLLEEIIPQYEERICRILSILTPDERKNLRIMMEKLDGGMGSACKEN